MRSDDGLDERFTGADAWTIDLAAGESLRFIEKKNPALPTKGDNIVVHAHSGNERNHVFMNDRGASFHDFSAVSGADSPGDGRSFATGDFDRDGRTDLALVSANSPLLALYRNQTAAIAPPPENGNFIAVRLTGGNVTAEASDTWSNRDAIGAVVTVTVGERAITRALACGEGFAAQNSATMVIGTGAAESADRVTVRWPSGRIQNVSLVDSGTLLLIDEASGIVSPVPYNPKDDL